jgi:hypothetical protein
MSDETNGLLANRASFDEYFLRTAERLRARWEERVEFIRAAIDRLESLRRTAESLGDAETVSDLNAKLGAARTILAELEAAPAPAVTH